MTIANRIKRDFSPFNLDFLFKTLQLGLESGLHVGLYKTLITFTVPPTFGLDGHMFFVAPTIFAVIVMKF